MKWKDNVSIAPKKLAHLGRFIPVPLAVLTSPKLSSTAILAYALLQSMNRNKDAPNQAWPSSHLLRGFLGLSKSRMSEVIKELRDAGLIHVHVRGSEAGTNLYRLQNLTRLFGPKLMNLSARDWNQWARVRFRDHLLRPWEKTKCVDFIRPTKGISGLYVFGDERYGKPPQFEVMDEKSNYYPKSGRSWPDSPSREGPEKWN